MFRGQNSILSSWSATYPGAKWRSGRRQYQATRQQPQPAGRSAVANGAGWRGYLRQLSVQPRRQCVSRADRWKASPAAANCNSTTTTNGRAAGELHQFIRHKQVWPSIRSLVPPCPLIQQRPRAPLERSSEFVSGTINTSGITPRLTWPGITSTERQRQQQPQHPSRGTAVCRRSAIMPRTGAENPSGSSAIHGPGQSRQRCVAGLTGLRCGFRCWHNRVLDPYRRQQQLLHTDACSELYVAARLLTEVNGGYAALTPTLFSSASDWALANDGAVTATPTVSAIDAAPACYRDRPRCQSIGRR